jgi:hypothetical protein
MCVEASVPQLTLYPTMRFFARNRGGSNSALQVEVLFEDISGTIQNLPIGVLTASERWEPTVPIPVVANLLPNLGDPLLGQSAVAFSFSPLDNTGEWRIDDVYVDPYRSR